MSKEIMKADPVKVDGNTGQIVEVHPTTEEVVAHVSKFLDSKEKKVFFNGKRYAEYDDFQYIGTFYGITVKTFDPHFVEIGGRKGFHAKAMLLRDQQEIGRAEGFCMDDEPNWRNKPLFQLASMAQTRAAAKAYSNLFRPIIRMAGLEGTPAEEMDSMADALPKRGKTPEEIKALGQKIINPPEDEFGPMPGEIDAAEEVMTEETAARPVPTELEHIKDQIPFSEPPAGESKKRITEKQVKFIWVMLRQAGITDGAFKGYLKTNFGIEQSTALDKSEMDNVLAWIKRYQQLNPR